MKSSASCLLAALPLLAPLFLVGSLHAAESTLRVASVRSAAEVFPADDASIIFRDEFETPPDGNPGYVDYNRSDTKGFIHSPGGGRRGGGMIATFEKGQVDAGSLKVFFGRSPMGNKRLRKDEDFHEIHWRVYVKHEPDWEGNPAKLARATSLISPDWRQGFIAHVWGGKSDCLCIDPATGIVGSRPVTDRYNDFAHLKWLGSRNGKIPIFSSAESGRWVCIESHVRLNSTDKPDGVFELWVDGKLEASRNDIDWHGHWNDYAINAVFLENYWNDGSVKRQSRWFDNFVIRTQPIGPAAAERPVRIERTLPSENSAWEAEIAADSDGKMVLWRSSSAPAGARTIVVDAKSGTFTDGVSDLPAGKSCWIRLRRTGEQEWSPWHSPFR